MAPTDIAFPDADDNAPAATAATAPVDDVATPLPIATVEEEDSSTKQPAASSNEEATSEKAATANESPADTAQENDASKPAAVVVANLEPPSKKELILTEGPEGSYRYQWSDGTSMSTETTLTPAEAAKAIQSGTAANKIGDDEAKAVVQRYLQKLNTEEQEDKEHTSSKPACSCRRSTCVLLYCPCFGEGNECHEDCKCKNCRNPRGANPISKQTEEKKRAEQKKEKEKQKEAKNKMAAKKGTATSKEPFPALLMLTVSPGRLGLTLAIVPEGGAKITHIDPACTFRGQIQVGDRIVTIDGNKIETLEDLKVGKERVRKFGIVKKAIAPAVVGGKPIGPTNAAATAVDPRKQTFPYLKELNANGTDRSAEHRREDIFTELLQWDKKNNINSTAKMGACRYQVLCIPLKRRETVNKRELDNQCFHQYNKQTKVFDKFLNAWASYCDGTQEDAANMLLFNLAKRFPQCYVQNFEMATKKHEKMTGPPPVELPPNFVSYDETNDIRWNTKYSELVKYKEENGDCKVYTKTDLGRWVCSQRSARSNEAKNLSSKRIELLDNLDFLWSGLPDGWARPIPGGDPRQNRAIAAKIVYPDLTIREVLHLGGFDEEELNVIKDQKHTWRTGYVYYKDMIVKKVENYESARRSGARLQIEQLVNTLQGEDEDRFEQVFGEHSIHLTDFLEAAEERRRHGVVEKPRARSAKKRRSEDVVDAISDEEQQPERKQPYHTEDVAEQEEQNHVADEVDFQPQVAYDHIANAQQVARDLHSWRSQSNYWK